MLSGVREEMGRRLFARVAGPEGPKRRERVHGTPGERWFAEGTAIQRVHGDASMFTGGIRALLLQSLHPLAMAGVADHSGFEGDPWGRLQRTSYFLAVTTFGTAADAEKMVAAIRRVHEGVVGTAPDGRPYAASDPHLLEWVHVAEVDSFLTAHQRYGDRPLDQAGRDAYVAETARVAEALGVTDPPRSEAQLAARLEAFRPELAGTPAARATARFLLLHPPLPLLARTPYGVLAATAVSMMPRWARRELRLPYLPVTEAVAVRTAGTLATRAIRWAMAAPQAPAPSPQR
ncbi:oxygenase MpaB family protein [Nocardioides iriomotensis]|uniref:oxygenase MpaB family protein n=1 Tax=Nocardioides iriomotensis TaxID=715784 RepID=UPI001F10B420|nr:oxygenase MpaB family protein [Nocardioides iriomotensis]